MRIRSTYFSLTALSSVLLLGACGYSMGTSTHQDITFLSPEAQDAKCLVTVDKKKYKVVTPQSVNIKKSSKDMEIACQTEDNRTANLTVPAKFGSKAMWGEDTGSAWDYRSQPLHYYPDVITINFSEEAFIAREELVDLEEFSSPEPMMMDKEENTDDMIIKVEELVELSHSKGDMDSVLDELRETPTEVLKEADSANSEPVDLFPGQ